MTQRRALAPKSLAMSVALALTGGLLAAPTAAWAAAPTQLPTRDATGSMFCTEPGQELAISPAQDLTKGQEVTWKTTTEGTTPETLSGEYVGKLTNGLGKDAQGNPRDLLLVKLDSPVVNGEDTTLPAGVWAGASGSPVYDSDGALIGAVSYGFSTEADNVAGVTPAAAMKSIGDLPSSIKLSSPAKRSLAKAADTSANEVGSTAKRLKLARVTSGATANRLDKASQRLAEKSKGKHKAVAAGGVATNDSVSSNPELPSTLVPGGNVAVTLAHGDVTDGSVGTVTAVCSDDVWAFGHPNNFDSTMVTAMHNASAARIVPSAGESFKQVDEIGPAIGTVTEDRFAGIKGHIGKAKSVPVTAKSIIGGHTTNAQTDVTERYELAPATGMLLSSEAQRVLDNGLLGSAKVHWSIDYVRGTGKNAQSETLHNSNRYAEIEGFPELLSETGPAEDVAALVANPFERVQITAVRMTSTFSADYEATKIAGVQQKVNGAWKSVKTNSKISGVAGKTYPYRAVLAPTPDAKNTTEYVAFNVRIPQSAKNKLTVSLDPAAVPDEDDFWSIIDDTDDESGEAEPTNFAEFVAQLDDVTSSDTLSITRSYTSTGGKPTSLVAAKSTKHRILDGNASWTISVQKPAPKKITTGTVKIKGTAKVGNKLTASKSGWKPSGLTYSYQWLANGKKISKATKSSYTIAKADKGKRLSVKVTAKKSGYKTTSKTSARTKAVAK
ncbi:hypothetical protein [Galactobacter sp.]|uniref:hypothetical protein n=1 Tax=Galactobacter sp. TaxID=2676125 RepID=UPI0025B98E6E|nr:hypothetical protein [Galactobacter sp.]